MLCGRIHTHLAGGFPASIVMNQSFRVFQIQITSKVLQIDNNNKKSSMHADKMNFCCFAYLYILQTIACRNMGEPIINRKPGI